METITAKVTCIQFHNDAGWTVAYCRKNDDSRDFKMVGVMEGLAPGMDITAAGKWEDSKYGWQFKASRYAEVLPATAEGIRAYLGSGKFGGLGKTLADRIVAEYGSRAIEVIESDPDSLKKIRGIGPGRAAKIRETVAGDDYHRARDAMKIMVFLEGFGISPTFAERIYERYKDEAPQKLREDPYILVDDIDGIGFPRADEIAESLGIKGSAPVRLKAGLRYVLESQARSFGHCYLKEEALADLAASLLKVPGTDVTRALYGEVGGGSLIMDGGRIYLPEHYLKELSVAREIKRLMSNAPCCYADERLYYAAPGMEYDRDQETAVFGAAENKVFYITGGPGTGKTTILKAVAKGFAGEGFRVLLAAPTGRAAKRLSESTGREALTIHRLLGFRGTHFLQNEKNPLAGDVLVVDECSMIDLALMDALLRALPDGIRLILVGDADQLPSVAPGNVFCDIIASGTVPGIRLTKIFRQAEGSRIVTNAHRISKGLVPDLSAGLEGDADFRFSENAEDEPGEITADRIVRFCAGALKERYGIDPVRDAQILSPMYKRACGVNALNSKLQAALNPSCAKNREYIDRGSQKLYVGDKVMQLRNNYDKGVYNGDIGFITFIDKAMYRVTIEFDDVTATYDFKELSQITLAYAATIHKAQGSECRAILMPVLKADTFMLSRNLLYTGVTRASEQCVLFGEREAVARAVNNTKPSKRNTTLTERLREAAGQNI